MRHLQHLKNTDATCEQRFADINEKQLHPEDDGLQHVNNIVTTPIYNNCNKKNLRKNRRQVLRIRACLGHGWSGSLLLASSAAHATALGCGCAVRGGGLHPCGLVTQLDRRTGATPLAPAWGRCVRDAWLRIGWPTSEARMAAVNRGLGREVWETCAAASRTRSSRRSSLGPSPPAQPPLIRCGARGGAPCGRFLELGARRRAHCVDGWKRAS
jgi:hypothetical protein